LLFTGTLLAVVGKLFHGLDNSLDRLEGIAAMPGKNHRAVNT
jgi:hypothetical protein